LAFDLVQGGHGLARRIERQFVLARKYLAEGGFVQAPLSSQDQQCGLGGIAGDQPLPVLVIERGIVAQRAREQGFPEGRCRPGGLALLLQFALRLVARAADPEAFATGPDLGHRHCIFGQGPGLVGTDHRGAAQGFDGRQVADDGAAFGHAADADRQRDAHGRRQSFGDGADGQRHGGHQHGGHRFAAPDADDEGERGEAEDHPQQKAGELAHLLRQGRGDLRRAGDQARDATRLRRICGGDDQAVALAGDYGGAGVGHVAAVGEQGVDR
jgi:hypothetical protein